jgi:TPR repeat protein
MDEWREKLQRKNERTDQEAAIRRKSAAARWIGAGAFALLGAISLRLMISAHDLPQPDAGVEIAGNQDGDQPMPSSSRPSDGYALYERGDFLAAIDSLRPLAEGGDLLAQCRLGIALAKTAGNDRARQVEAVKWMDQCMRDPEHRYDDEDTASRELTDALIHEVGWDVVGEGRYHSFQFQQARLNFESGAPNGASGFLLSEIPSMGGDASFWLGVDLYAGNDMPVDYEKGFLAFQRAVKFDIPEAAYNLGLAYYVGKGTKADPVQALHWLQIATEGGFAKAATLAGVMLARGHGAPQDIDAALDYLQRGAELGDADAALIAEAVADGNIPF